MPTHVPTGPLGQLGQASADFAQGLLLARSIRQSREAEEFETVTTALPLIVQGNIAAGTEILLSDAAGRTGPALFERLPDILNAPEVFGPQQGEAGRTFTKLNKPAAQAMSILIQGLNERDGLVAAEGGTLPERKVAQQELRAKGAKARAEEAEALQKERKLTPKVPVVGTSGIPAAGEAKQNAELIGIRTRINAAILAQDRQKATLDKIGQRLANKAQAQQLLGISPAQRQGARAFEAGQQEKQLARQERNTAARVASETKLQERIIASRGQLKLTGQRADLERILRGAAEEVTRNPEEQDALVADSLAQGRLALDLENSLATRGIDQLLNARLTSVRLAETLTTLQEDVDLRRDETALLAEFQRKGKLDEKDIVVLNQLIDRTVGKLNLPPLSGEEKSSLVRELLVSGALGGAAAAIVPGGPVKRGVVGILAAIGAFLTQKAIRPGTPTVPSAEKEAAEFTAAPVDTPSSVETLNLSPIQKRILKRRLQRTQTTPEQEAVDIFLRSEGF